MVSAARLVLAALLALAAGCTVERTVYKCTACLVSDPAVCATNEHREGGMLEGDLNVRNSATFDLCRILYPGDIVKSSDCGVDPPPLTITCTSSRKRFPKPSMMFLWH